MKKFTVAALALTTLLSGSAFAHEAGEFFMRAGGNRQTYRRGRVVRWGI